jgi:hypothetical protein
MMQSRADVEAFYDTIAAYEARPRGRRGFGLHPDFDVFVEAILFNYYAQNAFKRLKSEENLFLLGLSLELVENGTVDEWESNPEKYLPRVENILISIEEAVDDIHISRQNRRVFLVDALCEMFGVSKDSSSAKLIHAGTHCKYAAYAANNIGLAASTLSMVNLIIASHRLVNEDFKVSRQTTDALAYTLFTTLACGAVTMPRQLTEMLGILIKGLFVALSHYAASDPMIVRRLLGIHTPGNAEAVHFMHSKNGAELPRGQNDTHYHVALALCSFVWPFIMYIAYFGGGSKWKMVLMALILHNSSLATTLHRKPRGETGALSSIGLWWPNSMNSITGMLRGNTDPLIVESGIAVTHSNELRKFRAVKSLVSNAAVELGSSEVVGYANAEDFALDFLDIMGTYLKLGSRPVMYDAFDLFDNSAGTEVGVRTRDPWRHSLMTMINAQWPSCSFTPMNAYTFDELLTYSKKIVGTKFVSERVYNNRYSTKDNKGDFFEVAKLLKPTIRAFLYSYYRRGFAPEDAGVDCLDLKQPLPSYNYQTADFLNRMDGYFFTFLKTELGISDDRFHGVKRFFTYGDS